MKKKLENLIDIGGRWYFDRAFGLQRLKNQSLYDKILFLQKFNDTLGKVLKHFIFSLCTVSVYVIFYIGIQSALFKI